MQAKEKGTQLIDEDGLIALVKATEHLAPQAGASAGAAPWSEAQNPRLFKRNLPMLDKIVERLAGAFACALPWPLANILDA